MTPRIKTSEEIASYWSDLNSTLPAVIKKRSELAIRMANQLEKEFGATGRIFFDDESQTIMIDGEYYEPLKPISYGIFRILATVRPKPLTISQIVRTIDDGGRVPSEVEFVQSKPIPFVASLKPFPIGETGGKRIDRALKKITPESLRNLIKYDDGRGLYLALPNM